MARFDQITSRDGLQPEQQRVWDDIQKSRGAVRGPFSVLLHSAALAERTARLGSFIRFEASVPLRARVIACLATARQLDCQYEWSSNVTHAREMGLPEQVILALRDRRAPADLEGDDRLAFEVTDQLLTKHRLATATRDAAIARFGVIGLVELVASVGYYSDIAMSLNAFEVDPRPTFESSLPI